MDNHAGAISDRLGNVGMSVRQQTGNRHKKTVLLTCSGIITDGRNVARPGTDPALNRNVFHEHCQIHPASLLTGTEGYRAVPRLTDRDAGCRHLTDRPAVAGDLEFNPPLLRLPESIPDRHPPKIRHGGFIKLILFLFLAVDGWICSNEFYFAVPIDFFLFVNMDFPGYSS